VAGDRDPVAGHRHLAARRLNRHGFDAAPVVSPGGCAHAQQDRSRGEGAGVADNRGDYSSDTAPGSQYTSFRFTEHLELTGIAPSIGTVGDAYDNTLMESFIGLFKTECITTTVFHDGPYKTPADVEYATGGWIDWYNRRLHSTLGMVTPAEYEQAHYAAVNREPQPT